MNAKTVKAIRRFMKAQMKQPYQNNPVLYHIIKSNVEKTGVLPRTNWALGDQMLYRFDNGIEKEMKVIKISGYSLKTGELHMVLVDDLGVGLNSAYDKNRVQLN